MLRMALQIYSKPNYCILTLAIWSPVIVAVRIVLMIAVRLITNRANAVAKIDWRPSENCFGNMEYFWIENYISKERIR
jgi:hypothetical protein